MKLEHQLKHEGLPSWENTTTVSIEEKVTPSKKTQFSAWVRTLGGLTSLVRAHEYWQDISVGFEAFQVEDCTITEEEHEKVRLVFQISKESCNNAHVRLRMHRDALEALRTALEAHNAVNA